MLMRPQGCAGKFGQLQQEEGRNVSTDSVPLPTTRDLPEPPTRLWPLIGPGIVTAGVGLGAGEFILWPYIASQVGLGLLWGAAIGVLTQWFINMEIERYT